MNVQYGTTELYFNCQPASNVEACQQGIKDGTFDITTLGGGIRLMIRACFFVHGVCAVHHHARSRSEVCHLACFKSLES